MGDVVLYHRSGARDFSRVGPGWKAAELRSLLFNAKRLLRHRGQTDALELLDTIPFSIYPAINLNDDEFEILFAQLPLAEYEELGRTPDSKAHAARQIVDAIVEAEGPLLRFVAVGLDLTDPEAWEVFLCHASEDKSTIARPLYEHLEAAGIRCWFDQAEIAWGESLISKIQEGISRTRFVIVILSASFLQKPWAKKELRTALSIEIETKRNLVLPLLVGDPGELLASLPFLKEKRYLLWNGDASIIEDELRALVRKQPLGRASDSALPSAVVVSHIHEGFERLRRRVLYVSVTNEIPGILRELRLFFIDKGLVDRAEFRLFFDRWLSSPFSALGPPVLGLLLPPNLLSVTEIQQMNEDLRALQA